MAASYDRTVSTQQSPRRSETVKTAALGIGGITAGLYGVEAIDHATSGALDNDFGLRSHDVGDLWAVFTSPLVHANWAHLASNSVPLLIFGFLVLLSGVRTFVIVSLIGAAASGFTAWLLSPSNVVTVGASGVIFALMTYLIVRGVYTRKVGHIALGVVLAVLYGGLLWGVLPSTPGVSWQAHLGGALGGFLAAYALRPKQKPASA